MTAMADEESAGLTPLGRGGKGFKGVVVRVGAPAGQSGVDPDELERRLLEIGFVEGARVEILEVGLIGGDPLAIRLDDMRVAVRRREAEAVLVRPDAG
jgi:ferrous iron transport protein A